MELIKIDKWTDLRLEQQGCMEGKLWRSERESIVRHKYGCTGVWYESMGG